jgi:S-adenosyl-L-methionine hydrolase (adenosine-forming)
VASCLCGEIILVSVITLLTDFGTQDYFVAAMKGVILSANPDARIVDISHEIPPQDIQAGAFNLLAVYRNFPVGTIHAAVVDPGVGSDRRAIIIECAEQFFVGPDNGLFSWIVQREGKCRIHQVTNEKFFWHPVSHTFHGRDVFAPVAAALSNGNEAREFGPHTDSFVELESLDPQRATDGSIAGAIIHIDRFGNCITNLTRNHLGSENANALQVNINGRRITSFRQFFSQTPGDEDELFMFLGSAGFIEIAARNASAASILNAQRGQLIVANPGPVKDDTTSR